MDAKRREDLAREDARMLATMFPLCRATGNHRVAQNDEPEPTEMVDLDAVRRAGL
jgi:hypothetical protein